MFENQKINTKLKLSALWTSLIALYIYGDYFELYVPEKVEGLLNGVNLLNSPTKLLTASIGIMIPALMISLSVLLKPRLNRILNILFALLLTLIEIFIGSISISSWYSFYVLYAFIEVIITVNIIWTAWKWPIQYTRIKNSK